MHNGCLRLWSGKDGKLLYSSQLDSSTELLSSWNRRSGNRIVLALSCRTTGSKYIDAYDWCSDELLCFRVRRKICKTADRVKVSTDQDIYACKSGSKLSVHIISNGCTLSSLNFDSEAYPKFDFALAGSRIAVLIACDTLFVRFHENYIDDTHLLDYDPPAKEALCDISGNGCIVVAACRNGTFGVWSVDSRSRIFVLESTVNDPISFTLSWNGKVLIAGYAKGHVLRFDLNESASETKSALKCEDVDKTADVEAQDETKCIEKSFIVETASFLDNIKSLQESLKLPVENMSVGLRKELSHIYKLTSSVCSKINSH